MQLGAFDAQLRLHATSDEETGNEGSSSDGSLLCSSSEAMLSLSTVLLCARTQVVKRAHTRKLGTHINIPSRNVFAPNSYTSSKFICVEVNCDTKEIFYVHTDFKN